MGNALFIIWRESAEAMLVVGILYAWLTKHPDVKRGMRYLWGGVAAGVGLALALAARDARHRPHALRHGPRVLPARDDARGRRPDRADGVLDASARSHVQARPRAEHAERTRRRPTGGACSSSSRSRSGARARRPSCFSTGWARRTRASGHFLGVLVLGLAAAFATFWALQQGGKILSWRRVLPRERNPAAAARRRAARLRGRQADRAGRAAAARRPAVGHLGACSTTRAASAAWSPRSPATARVPRCCRCCCSPSTGPWS